MSRFQPKIHEVVIDKLVHGGQGIGTLENGKKALVWNVLPGERVRFETRRSKSSFVEGIAIEIIEPSADRETPRDELYLSTSPWQMMTYDTENTHKQLILQETLQRAGVHYSDELLFNAPQDPWHYRNKMEYSFWGDDDGLHLALYNRGTHQKQVVQGSSIARPEIDIVANQICAVLSAKQVRAGDLKSLIVRCNQAGECVAALFTRNEAFPHYSELDEMCSGVAVYFSNPKSPASVLTKELYTFGSVQLTDELLGRPFSYDVVSFFQVNLPAYETVLTQIRKEVQGLPVVDMYAGTGSIGLSVADGPLSLVELDPHSVAMARQNVAQGGRTNVIVVHAPSEQATDSIAEHQNGAVIFDPPRAGLHSDVTAAVLDALPPKIVYLSCNPSTLARDLALLQNRYTITSVSGHNFFPRTPHIEALATLEVAQ